MLYLVGLGLKDEKSISIEGFEIVKRADYVFLESYTSKLVDFDINRLNSFFNKKVVPVERDFVENTKKIIELSVDKDVVLLVVGDPMIATTHIDLVLEAEEKGVEVRIINNASVINAVANLGLQVYKFGKITSIPFPSKSFRPETPYNVIKENKSINAHTLCLLDIQSEKGLFMSCDQGIDYLLSIEEEKKQGVFTQDSLVVCCSGLGSEEQRVLFGRVKELKKVLKEKLFVFPQCLIVPSKLHFMEEKALKRFSI